MEVVVREYLLADEGALQVVAKQALATLRKHYVPGPSAKKVGSESPFTRLVAICENRIVGTLIFEEDKEALYFGSVGVLDEYRRKGVLSAMMNNLEQIAKDRKIQKLTCATILETGNVQIFKRLGFQVISSELTNKFTSPSGEQVTEVRLEKLLARADFNIDGYCIRSSRLSPDECARLSEEVERIHDDILDLQAKFPHIKKISEWSVGNPHHASPLIHQWIMSEINIQVCQELIGENVDLYWAGTAHKPPLTGKAFPWHQDAGYGGGPSDFITCWTALDDVDEDNGCFWVIPGSHRNHIAPHELRKSDGENYGGAFLVEPPSNEDLAIPVRLKAGEMICFSSKLIHETRRNNSPKKRRAIIASYVDSFLLQGHELPAGVLESLIRP